MNVTIREYIRSRVRWCFAIAAAGWLLIALGGGLAAQLPHGFPDFALPLLGGLLFAAAILAMQRIAKCPKCNANLGRTIAVPVAMSFGSGPKINFCPYCGVHLDQPRFVPQPQSVASAESDQIISPRVFLLQVFSSLFF
jgi:hypothetical protein